MDSEFELKYRVLQLETLYDVGLVLQGLQRQDALVEELLHRAVAVLNAACGAAFAWGEGADLEAVASVGLAAGPEAIAAAAGSEPLASRFGEPRPFVESKAARLPVIGGFRPRQMLAAPLCGKDGLLGFLLLFDKEGRAGEEAVFGEADLKFVTALSQIGGIALESTRSYERLQADREKLEEENRSLKKSAFRDVRERRIVGGSPKMERVLELAERVALSSINVLLRGESGTGKELIAKLIHMASLRCDGPFIPLNCAAIPETLLEAELFGIERGVATGVEARKGKFEIAQGGTLFLDEIGDMPLALQAKLLRVVQEREIERVGGSKRTAVDVRLVAATHRDLEAMVRGKQFREDLYYRLKVVEIAIPPLRERKEDIPELARYFLEQGRVRDARGEVSLSRDAMRALLAHSYPGNVRELENIIHGALATSAKPVLDSGDLPLLQSANPLGAELSTGEILDLRSLERLYIRRVLAHTGGNKSQAAKLLGIDRKTLYRKDIVG